MYNIKKIEDKYNKKKNWILGISAAVIIGSSWSGLRSLKYADQMESMNPYAGKSAEFLIAKTASGYLDAERKRLWKLKDMLKETEVELNNAHIKVPRSYLEGLEVTLEKEFKFVNDDFIEELQRLKDMALDLDKENKWDKKIREKRKMGTAIYFVNIFTVFVAGAFLVFNEDKKKIELKHYIEKQEDSSN